MSVREFCFYAGELLIGVGIPDLNSDNGIEIRNGVCNA